MPHLANQNSMPSSSFAMAWVNLSFEAKPNPFAEKKTILNNISGQLHFGTMTALMGPSGCGKSTLLRCINGRYVDGISDETMIFVSKKRKLRSCFIVQDVEEHLMYGLTGSESLLYASRIKNNNGNVGKVDHYKNIKKLMSELMISETANTLVENCSGGEQKRLVIAMELTSVKKPSVLCVDEPTSGLDSNAAEIVMKCLKQIAVSQQIAVITSIHQPNADVLLLFDWVYVLVKGGKTMFFGPPHELRHHLSLAGINCHEWQVPVEVMINLATEGHKDNRVRHLIKLTEATTLSQLEAPCKLEGTISGGIEIVTAPFSFVDLWYLMMRNSICIVRSRWKGMLFQFLVMVGFGLVLSQLYNEDVGRVVACLDTNPDTANASCKTGLERVQEVKILSQNISLLFFAPIVLMFLVIVGTALAFTSELKLFENELYNGWYSASAYYWAKTIVELPLVIAIGISFALVVFFGSKQYEEDFRIVWSVYIYVTGVLTCQGAGYFFGITVAQIHPQLTLLVILGVYEGYMLLCNYLMPLEQLPDFVEDISAISFEKHVFKSLVILTYGFDRCPKGQISQAMSDFRIEDDDVWWYAAAMVVHTLAYRVMAWLTMVLISQPPKGKKVNNKQSKVKIRPDRDAVEIINSRNGMIQDKGDRRMSIEYPNKKNSYSQTDLNYYRKKPRRTDLALAWINLTFVGQSFGLLKQKPKIILRQLSGRIDFGTLTALMGPSGSGKSTLLKCVNGQNRSGIASDSQLLVSQQKQIRSCFIVQDQKEHLLRGLTGKETLFYASKLKNNGAVGAEEVDVEVDDDIEAGSQFDHKKNIKKLLSDLMIKDASSTLVQKCSGGEQKRLTIAMEMTACVKPNVICIDEPTSGLDSNAAELVNSDDKLVMNLVNNKIDQVIRNLKSVAKQNSMAIITSIHQPNSDVLLMFDQVYMLAKGGRCIYFGPPQCIRDHLISCGVECPDWLVPVEVLLKVASKPGSEQLKRLALKTLEDNRSLLEKSLDEGLATGEGSSIDHQTSTKFSLLDVWYLVMRGAVYNTRSNWIIFFGQFVIDISVGLLLAVLYDKDMAKADGCLDVAASGNDSCANFAKQSSEEEMLAQNMRFIFFTSTLMNFIQMAATIVTFPSEVKIFLNEHRNGWYSCGSYYLSKTIIELPAPIVINGSCFAILYWLSRQLREVDRMSGLFGMYILEALTTQGMSFLFGLLFAQSLNLAIVSVVAYFIFSMFFCGFVAPVDEMNEVVQHLSHFSYQKHYFQSALVWTYGLDRCQWPEMSTILYRFELDDDMVWKNAIYLFGHLINFRFLAFLVLIFKARCGR